MAPDNGWGS
ncbi:hypothetical protein YPPY46_4510, partial [Yersinia pestis PY-46]